MQILTLQLRLMLLWHFFAIGSPKADAESVRLGAKSALNPANPYTWQLSKQLIARKLNSAAVSTLISVVYGVISKMRKFMLYHICNHVRLEGHGSSGL